MANPDLRDWLAQMEAAGELQKVSGANREEEIGGIVDLYQRAANNKAVLFDEIPGYPRGYRVAANILTGVKRIALAEPTSVPVGVYTSKYLTDEGVWKQIKPKVVPVQDVRATLAAVESGNVEAGFVYKTDAAVSRKVRIVYEVPIDKGPKITYPAAIVKESRHKDAARDFLNYIQSPTAKDAFKKYGFVVLD